MLPLCSATTCCSCHLQIPVHGRIINSISPCWTTFGVNWNNVDKGILKFTNGPSFKLYSTYGGTGTGTGSLQQTEFRNITQLIDTSHDLGSNGGMIYVDISTDADDQLMDFIGKKTVENSHIVQTEPHPLSKSFSVDVSELSGQEVNVSDIVNGVQNSFSNKVYGAEKVLSESFDTITSSFIKNVAAANEAVDNVTKEISSFVNKSGESAGDKLTGFSGDLKEASGRTGLIALDVLRRTVVVIEDSLALGVGTVGYAYSSAKQSLPLEFQDALKSSEVSVVKIVGPVGTVLQQVYAALEGLEKSLGLDPSDPLIPFSLFLGLSASLWVSYRILKYGGYAGDLSAESAMELLRGNKNAVLIDIRPENLRERDGIPDLRRTIRSRYASVTIPEVDGSVKKLLKGGREIEDSLLAAVIRNLKIVERWERLYFMASKGQLPLFANTILHIYMDKKPTLSSMQNFSLSKGFNDEGNAEKLFIDDYIDRSKVLVMDADGTRSKGVARSLRRLGTKTPYLVQGGFRSWAEEGFRVKELKPETALTILNEDAEAILEEINPTPVKFIGLGVGLVAATYSFLEWEKTLQFVGVIGLGQTIYRRIASYQDAEDLKQDVSLLLAPARLGGQAISWAAGKLEPTRNGLPTSPSSSDVQSRVLQAAAKHESQPSDLEEAEDSSSENVVSGNEDVTVSEA